MCNAKACCTLTANGTVRPRSVSSEAFIQPFALDDLRKSNPRNKSCTSRRLFETSKVIVIVSASRKDYYETLDFRSFDFLPASEVTRRSANVDSTRSSDESRVIARILEPKSYAGCTRYEEITYIKRPKRSTLRGTFEKLFLVAILSFRLRALLSVDFTRCACTVDR